MDSDREGGTDRLVRCLAVSPGEALDRPRLATDDTCHLDSLLASARLAFDLAVRRREDARGELESEVIELLRRVMLLSFDSIAGLTADSAPVLVRVTT